MLFTLALDNARNAFNLLLSIGAGTGLIYLLRWFWWRINAWSEVSAMIASFVIALAFFVAARTGHEVDATTALLVTIAVTTIVWIVGHVLHAAGRRRGACCLLRESAPGGPGWAAVRSALRLAAVERFVALGLARLGLGIAAIYGALFATGALIYGRLLPGVSCARRGDGGDGGALRYRPAAVASGGRPGAARGLKSTGSHELEEF